jgi:hypothetical protein
MKGIDMKTFLTTAAFCLGLSLLTGSAHAFESNFSGGACIDRSGHGISFAEKSEAQAIALASAERLCNSWGRQEGYPVTYSESSCSCEIKLSHDGTKYFWDCNSRGECCG